MWRAATWLGLVGVVACGEAAPGGRDGGAGVDAAQPALVVRIVDAEVRLVGVVGEALVMQGEVDDGAAPLTYAWLTDDGTIVGAGELLDTSPLPVGDHVLRVEVTDATGRVGVSAPRELHVLPESFDWSHRLRPSAPPAPGDWLTPVRHQQQCGSCWAYAAIAAMEARYNIQQGDPDLDVDLSEQDLIDCWTGAVGCGGGAPEQALDGYVLSLGVPTEACRPTLGRDDVCRAQCADGSDPARWRITSFEFGPTASQDADAVRRFMQDSIVHDGPMPRAVVYMYGWDPTTKMCTPAGGDHFALVVGYDHRDQTWLVRNSWGASWNGNGYFEIRYGNCAIDAAASVVGAVIAP